ncbi:MAG TPA: hypothetical protein PK344_15265 [Syntrophorhabdaceae bacterium]|jgi:hypothetical protein|nr:MAG: hypothetical protein BWY95_02260 [Bacteroidetes bacterium ADurb.BinA104]HOE18765.1 hypothetical protein [Syntrophorhabdaceae bacterium]
MATIADIEDDIITAIAALKDDDDDNKLFRIVESLGRKRPPVAINYPACFVYFAGDTNTGSRPRPIYQTDYECLVSVKNLSSEKDAADGVYALIDAVRDAIEGKQLDNDDIEPFMCVSRELSDYADGVISYVIKFRTRHYLAVPT